MTVILDSAGNNTGSYHVIYSPKSGASAYKANVTERASASSPTMSGIVWMKSDGTVIAVESSGQNVTGDQAFQLASTLVFPLEFAENRASILLPLYQGAGAIHVVNQTSIEIGATTVAVTNYGANSLPFGAGVCSNGFTQNITKFALQTGQVPGTTFIIVPFLSITGSETLYGNQGGSGSTFSFTEYVQITSITKA
ncbi:MAG: hypothetical protein OK474_06910 [Thaumarchaeota archaeon]|nr:hypothetical protein [Nitrososphaerota archaeon]